MTDYQQKLMLIDETDDETRIAILEKGRLQELHLEQRNQEQTKGNIYKAVVHKIQSSIQSCFVDFGTDKHGFLALSEINFPLCQKLNPELNLSKVKSGTPLLVQVTRDPIAHKGATLNNYLTIPGRYMVLLPYCKNGGVSKKIEDEQERDRLKTFLQSLDTEEHGIIIRTAGVGRSLQELKKDYTLLKRKWAKIEQDYQKTTKPGLVISEDDVATRFVRDYYTEDIETLWLSNPDTFQRIYQFMKVNIPSCQKDIKLFLENSSLFAHFGVEKQVEILSDRTAQLPSGGSIVIDITEALVAIDVNSGRSKASNPKTNALNTNLEAAAEVARQLKLRNLGGLIVIDFIDMADMADRQKVERVLKDAMQTDKASHNLGQISDFGLLELSRQQIAKGFVKTVSTACPNCLGKGYIPSLLTSSGQVLRKLREIAAKSQLEKIEVSLPLVLANYLLNQKRKEIAELEEEFGIQITLKADPQSENTNFQFTELGKSEPQFMVEEPQLETANSQSQPRPQSRPQSRPQPKSKPQPKPELKILEEPTLEKPKMEKPRKESAPGSKIATTPKVVAAPKVAATSKGVAPKPRHNQPATVGTDKPKVISEKDIAKRLETLVSFSGLEQKCFFEPNFSSIGKQHTQILADFNARLTGKIGANMPVFFETRYSWNDVEQKG